MEFQIVRFERQIRRAIAFISRDFQKSRNRRYVAPSECFPFRRLYTQHGRRRVGLKNDRV